MKKTILLFILVISLTMTSCGFLDALNSDKTKTVTFKAGYDYGFHQNGKASLLLDGSSVFFDPSDWGINTILAGDTITMTYAGDELMIQETYPSTVVTKDIEIKDITNTESSIISLVAKANPNGKISLSTTDPSAVPIFDSDEIFIISRDMTFTDVDNIASGTILYATCTINGNVREIHAIYDYRPR